MVEGVDAGQYKTTYGVTAVPGRGDSLDVALGKIDSWAAVNMLAATLLYYLGWPVLEVHSSQTI